MKTNYCENLLLDLNHEDRNISLKLQTSASSSSNLPQDQGVAAYKEIVRDTIPCGSTLENKGEINGLKLTIMKREGKLINDNYHHDHNYHQNCSPPSSIKWMSSKMRMLKKMIKSEEQTFGIEATSHNNPTTTINFEDHNMKHVTSPSDLSAGSSTNIVNSPTIRFCADCNATRTPLWRSGPQGPKSLCNACGIRQRKARRASMAAYGATTTNTSSTNKLLNIHKETGTKKRSKTSKKRSSRKLCFEEFALSLSKKLSLHQVFPPDEKEAAILLMAMSCGLLVEG